MMGPNTVTGHLSVIYTVECQINFTMRIIKPILKSMQSPQAVLRTRTPVDKVVVSATSQRRDNDWIQEKAKELVWATGCTSWFIDPKSGRNTQMYPDWQYKFWARSIFIPWQDFIYSRSKALGQRERQHPQTWTSVFGKSLMAAACCGVATLLVSSAELRRAVLNIFENPTALLKTLPVINKA